jgi:hypothetical protein
VGKSLMALILALLLFAQGCGIGIMAAGIGYAVSASKKGDAEVAKAEADLQKSYNEYKLGMEKINIERETKGLKPEPIMPIQEWLRHQALPEDVRANLAEKQAKYQAHSQPLAQQDVKLPANHETQGEGAQNEPASTSP